MEYSLLSINNGRSSSRKSNVPITMGDLSSPFRLAALLYFRISIRELPSTAKMHAHLVHGIRCNLESSSSSIIDSNCNRSLDLLAWIAFIGGVAASDGDDYHYFVGLLLTLCSVLGVKNKSQLQARLVGICWREEICNELLCKLWKEMESFGQIDGYSEEL